MKKTDKPNSVEENQANAAQPGEELGYTDDAVIGRAMRWSLVAVLVLAAGAGGAFWYLNRKPAPAAVRQTVLSAPSAAPQSLAIIPEVAFEDITSRAGIGFVHDNGAAGEKLLPETMGSGVAFLDFDNDGAQDLLFINGTAWPEKNPTAQGSSACALYRNNGQGQFTDVTRGSGLDTRFYGTGVAVGDYDNDGLVDVMITGVGGNHLFHNLGQGKFSETTAAAGVGGSGSDYSTSAAFVDYDNDGKLDLFVCNYVRWSREIDIEVGYQLVGVGRAYGQPMNFQGAHSMLYHNEGNGRFSDVSDKSGIQVKNSSTGVPAGKALGVAPVDIDNDGWIDLIVANDTVQNFVFHNQKNGTFKEIGGLTSIAFDSYGNTRGAMGIDTGRFRQDDALGIVIGNFANEMTALYVSQRAPLVFADESITEGIGPASRLLLKFGIFFFDYDLDGRLDVLSSNGHLEEEINKVQQSQQYRQPAQLFWNRGASSEGCFVSVPAAKAGPDLFKPLVGRGSAFADIDNDGDLDVVLTQTGGAPLLLRNAQKLGHHWLRFQLVGDKSNRSAIGAWIKVTLKDQVLWRQVMPTRSYLSQSELPVSIGLGTLDQAIAVEIVWPGGQTQRLSSWKTDSLTVVQQAGLVVAQ